MLQYVVSYGAYIFVGLHFCEFCKFGGVCEIIFTKFLRLRPPKGIIPQASWSHTFSMYASVTWLFHALDRKLQAARSNICWWMWYSRQQRCKYRLQLQNTKVWNETLDPVLCSWSQLYWSYVHIAPFYLEYVCSVTMPWLHSSSGAASLSRRRSKVHMW